jgi:hypothetical protein
VALSAFPFAFSVEVGFIAEREMNDAPFAGGHRAEMIRTAGLAHFFGGDGRSRTQFLDAHGPAVLTIETNFFVLAGRQAQHFKGEQLEGAQEFSTAIEQEW